jgi:hypothetical protein
MKAKTHTQSAYRPATHITHDRLPTDKYQPDPQHNNPNHTNPSPPDTGTSPLADPTPSRIETLVRTLANRRLLDGQFDDCELTLRELNIIVESVSRTLASMFHARIAYPAGESSRTG